MNQRSTMGERVVEWSHLPTELLPMIAKSLRNRIDLIRFRSVCKSWHYSVPPPHPNHPSFPINVPPLTTNSHPYRYRGDDFILTQTTFYHIAPPTNNNNDPSPKGRLIQVEEESNSLPMRLFHPLSNRRIMNPPKLWDLSHCGIVELCKSYTIKFHKDGDPLSIVTKVVFFPNSRCGNVEDYVVFCIFKEGRLMFMRYGDESWTLVDDTNYHYDDVIVYKGQFYVVDRWGTVSWIDVSSLRLIQCSPPLVGSGGKKDLVESCGGLYVVERYYEGEARRGTRDVGPDHDAEVVDFKVYKLDEEWGSWIDVKSLDDRVFVLGDRCSFSVLAEEFAGYHWNCIYFFDFNHVRMYNMNDGIALLRLEVIHPIQICSGLPLLG